MYCIGTRSSEQDTVTLSVRFMLRVELNTIKVLVYTDASLVMALQSPDNEIGISGTLLTALYFITQDDLSELTFQVKKDTAP